MATAVAIRLLGLSADYVSAFASHLADFTQMVPILNHELAAGAARLAFILWHMKLLSPRPRL
jgi:hypothetical protein